MDAKTRSAASRPIRPAAGSPGGDGVPVARVPARTGELRGIRPVADALELSTLVFDVVTSDRPRIAAEWGARMGLSPEHVLGSPDVLVGRVERMTEDLRERRKRHGISYAVVYEPVKGAFAPVVT